MEKFQLSVLFKIIGIGSASGLVYHDDKLYLISDNSTFLYEYNIPTEKLNKIALTENAQDNIAKKDKPDFEAIAIKGTDLILLGSGSTENRNMIFNYAIPTGKIQKNNIGTIYQKIKQKFNISDDELNIEGLIMDHDHIYFFQRGNGAKGKNGIVYSKDVAKDQKFEYVPIDLPKIKNVPTTFTDAILVEDKIYFLASAEDTESTYLDGEVLGSIIGTIDLKTMTLTNSIQISDKNKFEGLTLYKQSEKEIEFLLCEDTDSEVLESDIYKLTLKR
ncbi:hypothetical protein HKT18_08230 [Flavobacterium sp. IMCC34852]|uniref:Uncharacterized protein n=1 Tax=Flavobacterium rivulicola TaxID=2732161 RepID=A0A7Y3VZ79_9FLAO|nr:hypothetical protein [Flavobacterium sp. IMCC34852]NNT72196.1 hypothetical protein [Flavobacterium sp. IMCC34852]